MSKLFLRLWWVMAVRGALAIVFGVLAVIWPALTLLALVALFVAYALISGAVAVIGAANQRRSDEDWWLLLLLGICGLAAGLIAAIHPALTAMVLVVVIGAFALVTGVLDITLAIRMRKMIKNEWMMIISGAASIIFGLLVLLMPQAGALALVWLIALYAIIMGAAQLTLGLRMRVWEQTGQFPGAGIERRSMHDRRVSYR